MNPQTIKQILCCLVLGRYTACVEGGELRISGPQPLAGPLPASIKARRDELVAFLNEYCAGAWPPAPGSPLRPAVGREPAELEHKRFAKRYVEGRLRVLGRIRLALLQQILRDAGGEPSYALPAAKSLGCAVERLPEYENREFVFAPREWAESAVVKARRRAA